MANDFKVEQTYDELGEACRESIIAALLDAPEHSPPPSKYEIAWAENIANQATNSFLMQLDAAE